MSFTFIFAFVAMLVFQLILLPALHKTFGGNTDYVWGYYFTKFLAMPAWFALMVAGPLGIIPGILVFAGSIILAIVLMIALVFMLLNKNPELAKIPNLDTKASAEKRQLSNYFAFIWGALLFAGTIGGAMAMS